DRGRRASCAVAAEVRCGEAPTRRGGTDAGAGAERTIAPRAGGPEDRDGRRADGGGEVGRAAVVADIEIGACAERSQRREAEPPAEVEEWYLGMASHGIDGGAIRPGADQHDLRPEFVDEPGGQGGE